MLLALKRDRFRTSNVRGSAAALYAAKPQPTPALIIIRKLLTELSRALKVRSDSRRLLTAYYLEVSFAFRLVDIVPAVAAEGPMLPAMLTESEVGIPRYAGPIKL